MTTRIMADPVKLVQAQMSLWHDYMTLWQRTTRRFMGQEAEPVILPAKDDRRFKDSAWDENTLFDFIKQSYLLTARFLQATRARGRWAGRQDGEEGGFLYPPVRRCDGADQLRDDQSRSAARHHGERRRESGQGAGEPAGRPGARQGPAQHPDDRLRRLQGRQEHRVHAGQGGLPERPDAADPVLADDRAGAAAGRC